jgi:5'-3' exonuclease
MGVPGFFIWLWNKYKDENFLISNPINNINDLLIDANCLIHPQCFKVLDENKNWKNIDDLEDKMIKQIIEYIKFIIEYVNPSGTIYIAVDGVAPVAKIKQQRSRRYKSAKDNKLLNSIKKKHNKEITNFWTNASISPGTKFMNKITQGITNFIKNNNLLKNNKIIFSSANTPAEGEHKLLQYIRNNEIDNRRYVIYGLDADLIFLALSTQRDNIYLLREKQNINLIESDQVLFNYVNIDIMKDCIFNELKYMIGDVYKQIVDVTNNDVSDEDIEDNVSDEENEFELIELEKNRIINDFIFLCYFLGNDFLPHIPSINIKDKKFGGLELLLDGYASTFINVNDYIVKNENKKIELNKMFIFYLINNIAAYENDYLSSSYNKKKRRLTCESMDPYEIEKFRIENLQFKINDPIELGKGNAELWKYRYYEHYFNSTVNQKSFIKNICHNYFEGLLWIAEYYFNDCPSWSWYYAYDHGPFLSDMVLYLRSFDFNETKFDKDQALEPLTQLLCMLPIDYNYLVPKSARWLMIEPSSPITYLYPTSFEIDYLYKRFNWQGIPILPPLDIDEVKKHTKNIKLTKEEEDILQSKNTVIIS